MLINDQQISRGVASQWLLEGSLGTSIDFVSIHLQQGQHSDSYSSQGMSPGKDKNRPFLSRELYKSE